MTQQPSATKKHESITSQPHRSLDEAIAALPLEGSFLCRVNFKDRPQPIQALWPCLDELGNLIGLTTVLDAAIDTIVGDSDQETGVLVLSEVLRTQLLQMRAILHAVYEELK